MDALESVGLDEAHTVVVTTCSGRSCNRVSRWSATMAVVCSAASVLKLTESLRAHADASLNDP